MKMTHWAVAFGLSVVMSSGDAVADELLLTHLRQPTSIRQTAFEYDNYLYFAPQDQPSESPSDAPAPEAEGAGPEQERCAAECGHGPRGPCAAHGGYYDPPWTVWANALFLHRSTPNDAILVTDTFAPGGNVLLDASDFNFDYEPGWEIGLGRRLGPTWGLEGRYFNVDSWRAVTAPVVSAVGSAVRYATPVGNVEFPNQFHATYRSELESVELNARRAVNPWLDVLFGVRFVELKDGSLAMVRDIGPGLNLSTHSINAYNALTGFQAGADVTLFSRGRLSLEGLFKAGIYGNAGRNSVSITQNVGSDFASAATTGHTAFVGELGFTAAYQITDALCARAGYQLVWIEGVALASDQVAVSDPLNGVAALDFTGSPFYDGASIGLELAW